MIIIECTASTLRAMLAYCDPVGGPMIAVTDDSLAKPLVQRIKDSVGEFHGSQKVTVYFEDTTDEKILAQEFKEVAEMIMTVFSTLYDVAGSLLK